MKTIVEQINKNIVSNLWYRDLSKELLYKQHLIRALQILYVILRDISDGQLTLRATSLVYTTLLSIVPLLALSFSVLQAFGVHNQIEPLLLSFLQPLGEKGVEITAKIIEFVKNMKVGVLGSIGLVLLIYTVLSLIQKIEDAFNFIWHISNPRGIGQRITSYLTVILIGPVFVFSVIGITATFMNMSLVQQLLSIEPFGTIVLVLGKVIPYILIIGVFTFIYMFVPNTSVGFSSALMGGLVSGGMWEFSTWAFKLFIVSSTKYQAVYSGLAILILFLLFLYLCWVIVLVGASISFYYQHPEQVTPTNTRIMLSNRVKERLALIILYVIAGNYCTPQENWTMAKLVEYLKIPTATVEQLLRTLVSSGLLIESSNNPAQYVPGRDLNTFFVKDLLQVIRTQHEANSISLLQIPYEEQVEKLFESIDLAMDTALKDRTLRHLIED